MSLTVASVFARRGRHSEAANIASLGSFASAPQHHQQSRGYRFGRLSSYLQPYIHPDVYAGRPGQCSRYCENLYRRRSWVKHGLAEDVKSTLKRVVNNSWSSHRRGSQGAGRCLNTHASPMKTLDNPDGVRPGQNIEDVERAPLEHLLFGDKKDPRARASQRPSSTVGESKAASFDRKGDGGYVIDPITNRKVPRESTGSFLTSDQGVEVPIKTFRHYRPQFEPFRPPEVQSAQAPIFSDGPPPEAELRMYDQNKPWDSGNQPDRTALHPDEKTTVNHRSAPHPSLLEALNWEHRDVLWHSNDNIASSSAGSIAQPQAHTRVAPEYTDRHQYTVVRCRELDGKPKDEQTTQRHGDLYRYGAVTAHEPDGTSKVKSDSATHSQELNEYREMRSHEPDGKYAAEYTEAPDQAELASYSQPFFAHEPDGKYAANHVESERDVAELAKYRQPFFSYEPDGKYAAFYLEQQRDEVELSWYKPFRSHEPDGKYATNDVDKNPDTDELAIYGAFRSHEPDSKYSRTDGAACEPSAVHEYQASRSDKPDGRYTREAEPTIDAAKEDEDLANHEAFSYEDAETRPSQQESGPSKDAADFQGHRTLQHYEPDGPVESQEYEDYDPAELCKYQAVRWNEPDGKLVEAKTADQEPAFYVEDETQEKPPFRNHVEELMAQASAEADTLASETLSSSHQPDGGNGGQDYRSKGLMGNFVRDFPEEFSKSWTTETAQGDPSLLSPEQQVSDMAIQPALDRYSTPKATTTPTEDLPPVKPTEPALYKVLVYDPTMQRIETAETISIVPDSAAPLTPAAVLLRISNPARFFPHFAPLQAQGFEIVSGSGDVLIFRKVRDPLPEAKEQQSSSAAAAVRGGPSSSCFSSSSSSSSGVNPIDMTGGQRDYTVAAGRFASPTGFVNYDLPPDPTSARPSPVWDYSEASAREEGGVGEDKGKVGKKKGRSLPKRVAVGAVWLAGLSYSLGVVTESFKSGGVDGKGPKGF
ncbi:hypothetical protein N657DRAFT_277810 [Parathielavia appendiculata]|uniref:Uncharacterized protein n=1 Tax=Parathielavia appendiculata TaxID=2587402 RepID=A0AAN6Z5G0_9PEZI|nr:hypothetical protein N657DRAFT_277810 [Parathielavia appendiculata]